MELESVKLCGTFAIADRNRAARTFGGTSDFWVAKLPTSATTRFHLEQFSSAAARMDPTSRAASKLSREPRPKLPWLFLALRNLPS